MIPGAVRQLRAAEHPRHFLDAPFTLELLERRPSGAVLGVLGNAQLAIRLHCHLGEVSDAQHLP